MAYKFIGRGRFLNELTAYRAIKMRLELIGTAKAAILGRKAAVSEWDGCALRRSKSYDRKGL
jgi:hypothetical protein